MFIGRNQRSFIGKLPKILSSIYNYKNNIILYVFIVSNICKKY